MKVIQLDPFKSDSWFKKENRAPGIYFQVGEITAGSILSTVFVEHIDAGATLKVNYFDTTTGASVGERFDLASHDLITAAGTYRINVGGHHNRVVCEAIVVGGSANFSVYGTAKQSTDLSQVIDYNDDGEAIIRTELTAGESSQTSLKLAGRVSEVQLNPVTWTPLPAIPFDRRKSLNIQNYSGIDIKLNFDNTVSDFKGVLLRDSSERAYNIEGSIVLYAKSQTANPVIVVEEIA